MSKAPRRKRILFVEQNRDGTVGGSHFCLLDLLANLDRERFDPVVLFHEPNALLPRFQELAPVLVEAPPKAWNLLTGSGRNGRPSFGTPDRVLQKVVNALRVSLGSALRWRRLLATQRIDLVHVNNSIFAVGEWVLAARLTRAASVCHQRGYGPLRHVRSAHYLDRVICITQQIRDHILRANPELAPKAQTVYDALDTAAFLSLVRRSPCDVRRELQVAEGALLVGIVGNVKEWKGQRVVVEAFARLAADYPDMRCLIIGAVSTNAPDREYHASMLKRIEESRLKDRVLVTGFRSDVPDLVSALDILIHASVEPEPMGRVILEGMCLEKPVVATDLGGPREIIESGRSGFLVPPNDPERLAACVRTLADSPSLRREIGQAAARRVQERFGIAQHMAHIHGIYDTLLESSRG